MELFTALAGIVVLSMVILLPFAAAARLGGEPDGIEGFAVLLSIIPIICLVLLPFSPAIECWWKGEGVKAEYKVVTVISLLMYVFSFMLFIDINLESRRIKRCCNYLGLCLVVCTCILGYGWTSGWDSLAWKALSEPKYRIGNDLSSDPGGQRAAEAVREALKQKHYGRWH